jgi:hypothetical protein
MSCAPVVLVGPNGACDPVQVVSQGPQGPPGPAGTSTFTTPVTVASLPAPIGGTRLMVLDAMTLAFGSVVVGGGVLMCPVFGDGSTWRMG